jgi:hypothetical protein
VQQQKDPFTDEPFIHKIQEETWQTAAIFCPPFMMDVVDVAKWGGFNKCNVTFGFVGTT